MATVRDRTIQVVTPMQAGWGGINAALVAMQLNVTRSMHDPRPRAAAVGLLHNARVPGGARFEEARCFYEFAAERLEYRRDPSWLEFIQDPMVMLAHVEETERREGPGRGWAAGDCDDHAQVMALLGFQVRLPIVYVLVARDNRPFMMSMDELLSEFASAYRTGAPVPIHVYAAMRETPFSEPSRAWLEGEDDAPSGLISLDTARPGAAFNEHAPGMIRYVRPAVLET